MDRAAIEKFPLGFALRKSLKEDMPPRITLSIPPLFLISA